MESFPDVAVKVAHLNKFHTYLRDTTWTLSGACPHPIFWRCATPCTPLLCRCLSSFATGYYFSHTMQFHGTRLPCFSPSPTTRTGIGKGAERELLESFNHVSTVFLSLPESQQEVIADITARMGDGMALYISRNLHQGTTDIADYNLYCHFVAGLVGEGLSRIFSAAGYEAPDVAEQIQLANDMGLFLQKTNIIRDYLEVSAARASESSSYLGAFRLSAVPLLCRRSCSATLALAVWLVAIGGFVVTATGTSCTLLHLLMSCRALSVSSHLSQDFVDKRAFWPKEIWGEYASNLGDFAHGASPKAMACLNHMVADAMTHVPSCLRYLSKLNDPAVFRFCAIPQVMAIATLEELTSNPKVFTGVVKIRKGMAVRLMTDARDIAGVSEVFLSATRSIYSKMAGYRSQQDMLGPVVDRIEGICIAGVPFRSVRHLFDVRIVVMVGLLVGVLLRFLNSRRRGWHGHALPTEMLSLDVRAVRLQGVGECCGVSSPWSCCPVLTQWMALALWAGWGVSCPPPFCVPRRFMHSRFLLLCLLFLSADVRGGVDDRVRVVPRGVRGRAARPVRHVVAREGEGGVRVSAAKRQRHGRGGAARAARCVVRAVVEEGGGGGRAAHRRLQLAREGVAVWPASAQDGRVNAASCTGAFTVTTCGYFAAKLVGKMSAVFVCNVWCMESVTVRMLFLLFWNVW